MSICLFFAISIQKQIDTQKSLHKKEGIDIIVPSGQYMKVAVLGYNNFIADLYYLKAHQYVGTQEVRKADFPQLYPIIDLVTDLDPKFLSPHFFGGLALSLSGMHVDESILILKKAYKMDPNVWQTGFYLGFNYWYYLQEYDRAVEYTSKAASQPGAPSFLSALAANLYAESKRPDMAIDFLKNLKETTKDEDAKKDIDLRIKLAEVTRDAQILEDAMERFKKKYNKMPAALDDLVKKGIIDSIPIEPNGGYYYIDSKTGEIKSSKIEGRLKIHAFYIPPDVQKKVEEIKKNRAMIGE
ncbi:MAG: hypothetical protein HY034_00515 [Nitrospirae bacterium]|nr:hypothetical protein [Nitrospirota bacterium]